MSATGVSAAKAADEIGGFDPAFGTRRRRLGAGFFKPLAAYRRG
jgi:hypothetical protein